MKYIGALCTLVGLATATLDAPFERAIERRARRNTINSNSILKRDTDPSLLYPAYNLSVPIDHFHNDSSYEPHSDGFFNLRYWFDASYYKEGGPVIVLQSGETDGTGRLPFLQKGLLHQLAVATNGIGVVLEHRYYGTSFPTPDLSTENLRFLTTDQALADQAYFAQNVVFEGLEHLNLTAPNVPYIGYGGSYAGAFVAILRKLYPDVFWGTISSSGVTEAIWDYWAYFEPIRVYADQGCISVQQKITHMIDNIFALNSPKETARLKAVFGLPNVTYDNDFASVVADGIYGWQSLNWDPEVTDDSVNVYCSNLTYPHIIYDSTRDLRNEVEHVIKKGGYTSELSSLITPLMNWIGWLDTNIVSGCEGSQDDCFSTHIPDYYAQDDITQSWRSWPYQYCTQWGFLQTGSGVPADILPLISRSIDLEYSSIICVESFNITTPPNTEIINKHGGFNISYPRLAIIDGQHDPWRPATPHASPFNSTAVNRTSTTEEPFLIIDGAVHHWDENGLFANETTATLPPQTIKDIQSEEVQFVLAWLEEWDREKMGKRELA